MSASHESRSYRVTNPATGQVLADYESASDAEITAAVERSAEAQRRWARRSVTDRARIVAEVARLFDERADKLGALITAEMGKEASSAVGEAKFCKEIFAYYATEGPGLIADTAVAVPAGANARIQRLPLGPILGVMPWNYPYYQVARFAAPNLVLGNSVILKPAENCPSSALAIAGIMREAGVPDGVYESVFATHDQIARIVADPRVQGVSLTGSERAGTAIAEHAGRNLKKVVLELGGSDPYIVLDSADVAASARLAWDTRMSNNGQACNSNKRMIVMGDIYDEFVAELVTLATGLEPGDPTSLGEREFPPMASRTAAEELAAQVADAVAQGAALHAGGTVTEGAGAYFRPAVLTDVKAGMRAYSEELFGPAAVVYRVDTDAEAIALANDSQYGLGAAVFSQDEERASAVASSLEVGMTNVNIPIGQGASLPFGGVKRSGFGRELGPLGLDEFVNKRLFYAQQ
ncbi:aldehyde dehydrogenase family protein [Streptomyces sp. HGB0020]|uniref:aldehyde dehydrogenase family protein n=1 Tax=Streptomyces sp. HGB0020 TaxID=1078086 RepID=UPI00034E3650|nr:aldehyde dehydrogenase family protein [Streptomyces sp. HGB0020]EPD69474.1 hypothetical protein HMPREF1211_00020 [Streptomyces sp. HGB0020]